MRKITYKKSGVDIDKANIFVEKIKPLIKKTQTQKNIKQLSGFASLFEFNKDKYKKPMLVASSDGVGTKLMIAQQVNRHETVGVDLVGMSVNDLICLGAKPLFFLDYIACGKLKPKVLFDVVKGITYSCKQAGCALIGGETAEMPGMYKQDEYDLAGFCVGVVDKDKIINGSKIKSGDKIIGIQSNGLHSNGYSLVRKVLSKSQIKKYSKELLKPTYIYVKPVLSLMSKFNIKGIAHITGGAFYDKAPKIIPSGLRIEIKKGSWPVPAIFELIQRKANLEDAQMYRTFNMGIGLILVVNKKLTSKVLRELSKKKLKAWLIGEVKKGRGSSIL